MARYRTSRLGWIGIGGVLTIWSALAHSGLVDRVILPLPSNVARALVALLGTTDFLSDIGTTLMRVGVAILVAACAGVPIGLFLGSRRFLYEAVEGPVHALRSIPASALFPLLMLLVGVGDLAIITLAAYPALLVVLVNSASGAKLANKKRIHQARILGLKPARLIRDVLFYEALPQIFDGLRTAISYALVLVVAVEMFIGVGNSGVGRRIYDFQVAYRVPETYAAIIVAGSIGIILNAALSAAERKALHWLPHAHDNLTGSPVNRS